MKRLIILVSALLLVLAPTLPAQAEHGAPGTAIAWLGVEDSNNHCIKATFGGVVQNSGSDAIGVELEFEYECALLFELSKATTFTGVSFFEELEDGTQVISAIDLEAASGEDKKANLFLVIGEQRTVNSWDISGTISIVSSDGGGAIYLIEGELIVTREVGELGVPVPHVSALAGLIMNLGPAGNGEPSPYCIFVTIPEDGLATLTIKGPCLKRLSLRRWKYLALVDHNNLGCRCTSKLTANDVITGVFESTNDSSLRAFLNLVVDPTNSQKGSGSSLTVSGSLSLWESGIPTLAGYSLTGIILDVNTKPFPRDERSLAQPSISLPTFIYLPAVNK